MTFPAALRAMEAGAKVRRPSWPAGAWTNRTVLRDPRIDYPSMCADDWELYGEPPASEWCPCRSHDCPGKGEALARVTAELARLSAERGRLVAELTEARKAPMSCGDRWFDGCYWHQCAGTFQHTGGHFDATGYDTNRVDFLEWTKGRRSFVDGTP